MMETKGEEKHVLSRAVILDQGHILVCKTLDLPVPFYFLPGGHVEKGESVEGALLRELLEETGAPCKIKRFLGCLEYQFNPGYSSVCHHHEYNLIFEVESPVLKQPAPVPQLEEHIELLWIPLPQLLKIDFRAEPLKHLLSEWLASPLHHSFESIRKSLHFLHVVELKEINKQFSLSEKGKKGELISRIMHFLQTGEKLVTPPFPQKAWSQPGKTNEIAPDALMLKGAYKNDLKTRLFFKQLIGEHFHFTAFGIDWLDEQWMQGDPPTYQAFAQMWKEEHQKRQTGSATPKEEWAYIRFVQNWISLYPKAKREEILAAWEAERQQHKTSLQKLFRKHCLHEVSHSL